MRLIKLTTGVAEELYINPNKIITIKHVEERVQIAGTDEYEILGLNELRVDGIERVIYIKETPEEVNKMIMMEGSICTT